jgi:hypothetical protein
MNKKKLNLNFLSLFVPSVDTICSCDCYVKPCFCDRTPDPTDDEENEGTSRCDSSEGK